MGGSGTGPYETGRWRDLAIDMPEFASASRGLWEEGRYWEMTPNVGSAVDPQGGYALIAQGRLIEAAGWWSLNDRIDQRLLMHRGDFATLAERYPQLPEGHLGAGKTTAAIEYADGLLVHAWLALGAAADGDHVAARRNFAEHARFSARTHNRRIGAVSSWMEPFWREAAGESGALQAACVIIRDSARWNDRQRPWHRACFLLGDIDEATFCAQPLAQFTAAEVILLRAVRADSAGDAQAARADYHAWQALPTWQRGETTPLAEDAFVAWRLTALGGR